MTHIPAPADVAPQRYVDQAEQSQRLARPLLIAMCGLAGLILLAAAGHTSLPGLARFIERHDPYAPQGLSARDMQQEAIAQLISETDMDAIAPAAEGDDAVSRNAFLVRSDAPVEAARPFQLPRLSALQAGNAERCLTQAIYYEAATESDAGKAAVAQVILNRMRHPAYPDSICAVVYQGSTRPGCQFSFACDGSMAREPVEALWRRSHDIARAALAGHVHKPVGMATHYHANYVFPYWAPKLTKVEQIGAHIFYRWPGNWGRPRAFADTYIGREAIPSFDSLFKRAAMAGPLIEEGGLSSPPLRHDPTDHRSENDVGGRVDMTKGWTPNIPDPTKGRAQIAPLAGDQAVTGNTLNMSN